MNSVCGTEQLRYGMHSVHITVRNEFSYLYDMNSASGTELLRYGINSVRGAEWSRVIVLNSHGTE